MGLYFLAKKHNDKRRTDLIPVCAIELFETTNNCIKKDAYGKEYIPTVYHHKNLQVVLLKEKQND